IESFVFTDQTIDYTRYNPDRMDLIGTNGDDVITGSDFGELLDGRGGDDTLIGGGGGDIYPFYVRNGPDRIIANRKQSPRDDRKGIIVRKDDVVRFGHDITRDNVVFTKDGLDLLVSVTGRTDTLRIKNQFRSLDDQVERFEFYDNSAGTPDFLTAHDVEQILQIAAGNFGDNVITGQLDQPNVLDGGQGDDTLIGGNAADTYAFTAGYGIDTIIERPDVAGVNDRVTFGASVKPELLKF